VSDIDDLDALERELGPAVRLTLRRAAAEITVEHRPDAVWRRGGGAPSGVSPDPRETLVILESSARDGQPTDPPFVDTARVVLEPRMTSHRWRVVAAAAAVLVFAAAAVLAYRSGEDPTDIEPIDVTSTTEPRDPAAYVAVADTFMDAWVAGEGDAVVAQIGERGPGFQQVNIGMVAASGVWDWAIGDVRSLPALHDWFRAVGWELHRSEPCQLVEPRMPEVADSASVVCTYTYENDLTRAAARPAITVSLNLMVVGDQVTQVDGGMFDLDADLWLMFSDWIRREHPDDVAAMYRSSVEPPTPRLDEGSIALWERHVDEFVASPAVHTPPSAALTRAQFGAKARMICAAAALDAQAGGWSGHTGVNQTLAAIAPASQAAMKELRTLPRPEEDRAEIDELMSLLEDINRHVIEDTWFHNDAFYALQAEKEALGGRDFWSCPVGPLGG
jgi:hypothetical protein